MPPVLPRRLITHSAEETIQWGRELGAEWAAYPTVPRLILLIGELGSGKTTLAKGIVAGMEAGPEGEVTSPTFTLVHEYGGRRKVFHVDLYRIEREEEIESLGLQDLLSQNDTILVEWGEKLPLDTATSRLEVRLECLSGDERRITVELRGASGAGYSA